MDTGVPVLSVSLTPHQYQQSEHHSRIYRAHFVRKGREAAQAAERRRQVVSRIREKYGLSERQAYRLVSQPRGTQLYVPTLRADEDALTQAIIALASKYGRYGYRRITALLQRIGWKVGRDRVQRIWRREGLKVPKKHKPRARLWLNDGSCIRLRPERANQVWSFDFVEGHTHDGRSLRIMTPTGMAPPSTVVCAGMGPVLEEIRRDVQTGPVAPMEATITNWA